MKQFISSPELCQAERQHDVGFCFEAGPIYWTPDGDPVLGVVSQYLETALLTVDSVTDSKSQRGVGGMERGPSRF